MELEIPEINSLPLVSEKSVIVEPDEKQGGSFAAVYGGSLDSLLDVAKRMAKDMFLEIISNEDDSFAAKGIYNNCNITIMVSDDGENYQLKYGVSRIK